MAQPCGCGAPPPTPSKTTSDKFTVGILGDLHLDPRKMEDIEEGRNQWLKVLEEAKARGPVGNIAMVCLGDLGESKPIHPGSSELFSGTTECNRLAAKYLGSFGVPYEVIGGNHDLEGLDEFDTDEANLEMFLREHGKTAPHFMRQIADKTLLVGLSSTVFRDAKYTSHEVTIDDAQMSWFEDVVRTHPCREGWRVFVFTHAPPNGSGLRVLQENHVVNGCCWLNHSNELKCRRFIEIVRANRCIKAWFSGHFHLGQDYQDSITFPTIDPSDGPCPNRGSCVFVQTSVMRLDASRDGRQQSRLIRGDRSSFEVCTVDHKRGGVIRVDATVKFCDCSHEVFVREYTDEAKKGEQYFKVYAPCAGDATHPPDKNFIPYCKDGLLRVDEEVTKDTVAWWRMACGRVLGALNGMLVEYDASTLAPLGLVVGADELLGKRIAVIDSGPESHAHAHEAAADVPQVGMEGADCVGGKGGSREQAVVLVDPRTGGVTVVQPNEDGSYWRKIVRNKMVRMKEVRRIKAAKEFARRLAEGGAADGDPYVVSSWGPYTSTAGTARSTGVVGLTVPLSPESVLKGADPGLAHKHTTPEGSAKRQCVSGLAAPCKQ